MKKILTWEYIATKEKEDAYENVINKLNNLYTPEKYISLSKEEQEQILNNIIAEIRKINIFPIYYFNKEGVYKEIKSVIDTNATIVDNILSTNQSQGLLLLDFLFPNLHTAQAAASNMSVYDRFFDDTSLKKAIDQYLGTRKIFNMRTVFFSTVRYIWPAPINYAPMRAKALYETFCPENGVIYDYCAGFGGRMLGALSSKKNFTYIATDPNTETYQHLQELGQYIETVTNRKNSYQIYNKCAEDLVLKENSVDFAFSCPPFFTLEKYCDEETQSINKYKDYNDWLELFVRPVIKNCKKAIKDSGIYAVDIMNFWIKNKKYNFIDDWITIAKEEGLYLKGIVPVISKARKKENADQEQIFLFTKQDINLPNFLDKKFVEEYKNKIEIAQKKKEHKNIIIATYNIYGKLISIYNTFLEAATAENIEVDFLKELLSNKKMFNEKYYRLYKSVSEDKTIAVKTPICKIDNIIFTSFSDAGRYLSISRQAVQQAFKKEKTIIANKKVEWLK